MWLVIVLGRISVAISDELEKSLRFKTFRKKRENIMENRKYIDGLSLILAAYERKELPFKISSEDVEKLRKIYVQICNGLNPSTKQKQLAECYLSYSVEILRGNKKD